MKTIEQIKKETTSYLEKSSNHLFKVGGELMTIKKIENDFFIVKTDLELNNVKVNKISIEWYEKYFEKNMKSGIKFNLFKSFGKKSESIPYFKKFKELEIKF
jgi:cob(I)alamin adenosyltransferase